MNKKLLFAAFLFGSVFTGTAQTVLFEDDFENYDDFIISNIGNWTQIDVDGAPTYTIEVGEGQPVTFTNSGYTGTAIVFNPDATNPALTEGYEPHSGNKSLNFIAAVLQNEDNPALVGPNNDWMITPQITLGTSGNQLKFWAKSLTAQYGLERIKVAVSTTGNTSPTDFTTISAGNYIEVPTTWTEYTFPLDIYAGEEVYIAINYVSNDAFILLMDDFSVTTAQTAGINDVVSSKFLVYPNPAANIINISNAENILINNIELTDINGRKVKSQKFDNISEVQVNISDLTAGMYFMSINSDSGTAVKKIIKN